jgi:biotin synthase-related radical SAM superfamily protein
LGTASVLGLAKAKLFEVPTTAHFLLGSGCVNDCAFCAQARSSDSGPHQLSRVTWPEFAWEQIREPLAKAISQGTFKRVCVQAVECPEGTGSVLRFVRKVRALSSKVGISTCVTPYSVSRVTALLDAGASEVGLPVDAATKDTYARVKKGPLEKAWDVVLRAGRKYPGKVTTHLIVGLGENEQEMVESLVKARENGIRVGLFSFTPVRGAAMEHWPQPDVSHYRRIQLAAYYLKRGGGADGIEFLRGRISKIRIPPDMRDGVNQGEPFRTSGCPDCNRPYYNERPGQIMMNYPRVLSSDEARRALEETGLPV